MNKQVIILVSLFAFAYGYNDVDDTYDVDGVVSNKTALKMFLDCYLDKAPCDQPMMTHTKGHILEAVTDACAECDNTQKHMLRVFLRGVKNLLPEQYPEFKAKFDPDGIHSDADEKLLSNY